MPLFHLAMYYEQGSGEVPPDLDQIMAEVDALNDDLRDAGAWVTAAGFEPAPQARVVTALPDGAETTDGPYLATAEHQGGFWLIHARSMGDAIIWAERASRALRLPVEVRACAPEKES
ncbi:hypothetical protein Lsed01_02199 [Demequina sediminis]|uniref:YCII-related domain-containing protein n=1 Tax=Demequina sediminis TaxID=1930058 RepID=A0ABP9WIS4_9MICO|nr:YciI family protein [Demequina sediminis]BDZ60473.1 hypothetical protein GCM10025873_02640 [Demequina sediminis]